jgi:hypothetical protein
MRIQLKRSVKLRHRFIIPARIEVLSPNALVDDEREWVKLVCSLDLSDRFIMAF